MHMFRLDNEGGKEIYMKPGALGKKNKFFLLYLKLKLDF